MIELNRTLEDLEVHIIDNILFGSELEQAIIDRWFTEYRLEIEEKFAVYDELDSLQIKIIDEPKETLTKMLARLLTCTKEAKKIYRRFLTSWFHKNKISHHYQELIADDLARRGYAIIDDQIQDEASDNFQLVDGFINQSKNNNAVAHHQLNHNLRRNKSLSTLIQANSQLVAEVVRRLSDSATISFNLDDMYQAGMIGLLRAVEDLDVSLGYQIPTYWIKQTILKALADCSTLIRLPVHYRRKIRKYLTAENALWFELARQPTSAEISLEIKEPITVVEELQFSISNYHFVSLDHLTDIEKQSCSKMIWDDDPTTPEQKYDKIELETTINTMLALHLTDRDRQVLIHRFGLNNNHAKTLDAIGKKLNITRERVRQIEKRALKKLQTPKNITRLKEYFYTN